MGLDPGIGMLHTDQPSKNALVYDVMEPTRPEVDRLLYRFLTSQMFGAKDFLEKTDGTVTLSLALRRKLTEQSTLIARMVAAYVDRVARMLGDAADGRKVVPTLLTQSNLSIGRANYRTNAKKPATAALAADARCQGCGVKLGDPERMYCSACLPEVRDNITASFAAAGPLALAAARAAGEDPAHGGEAGRKRGETQRERAAARLA